MGFLTDFFGNITSGVTKHIWSIVFSISAVGLTYILAYFNGSSTAKYDCLAYSQYKKTDLDYKLRGFKKKLDKKFQKEIEDIQHEANKPLDSDSSNKHFMQL